jgi:hypothetical protein
VEAPVLPKAHSPIPEAGLEIWFSSPYPHFTIFRNDYFCHKSVKKKSAETVIQTQFEVSVMCL